MKVTVTAPSRLHLGLIDCGNATRRLFGGLGLSIDGFFVRVTAFSAEKWSFSQPQTNNPDTRLEKEVYALLRRLERQGAQPCRISVLETPPQHYGLGSKTSTLLSIAAGVARLSELDLNSEQIAVLTGRGGTSGIGVNTFFHGGVIADSGHNEPPYKRNFAPSSRRVGIGNVPRIISRIEASPDLKILLYADRAADKVRIQGNEELRIFRETMPLDDIENLRSLAAVYHGVIPALQENNTELLFESIRDLNTCGMKKIEVALQSLATRSFIRDAWGAALTCGVSSFGPTVYCIVKEGQNTSVEPDRLAQKHSLERIGFFSFDSSSRNLDQFSPFRSPASSACQSCRPR